MINYIHIWSLLFLFSVFQIGCDKEKDPSEEEQDIVIYTNLLPDIKSVHVKMNDSILVDQSNGSLSFTLLDKDLNIIQQTSTNFWLAVNVYHPFPNIDVIMQGGDYASAPLMPVGAYVSNNGCRSFRNNFTFNPASYDYWTTYIPVSENEYYLAGGSNWEGSVIVNIKDNVQSSVFSKVLEGYNILQGFSYNDVIHVIANKVSNTQPSDNNDIYYFRSADKGLTWTGKFDFGLIGYKDLKFQILSDGTIILGKSNMQNTFLSDNSGNSWKNIIHSMIFSDVSFLNKSVGIAILDLNTLYKTTDSGSSWNILCTLKHPAKYLNFIDESKGVVYNDNLIGYTNNGGKTWKYIINGQPD